MILVWWVNTVRKGIQHWQLLHIGGANVTMNLLMLPIKMICENVPFMFFYMFAVYVFLKRILVNV